jgi:hypothetical protein
VARVAEKGAQAVENVRCKTEKSRGSASCVATPLFRRLDPLAQRRGAGFELEPAALAVNMRFDSRTLRVLERMVEQNAPLIERVWNEHFG